MEDLRDLFKSAFRFKTQFFEIPSDRWETVLHQRLLDLCYEYDNTEDLAIIYYYGGGGHAYQGEETKEFRFAA